ncbi:MAG: VacJ family lipoprotein [Campylobacteraceae bacterium]|nr:VacJ family lipoprotein [Campylobacteraceae bacterium]
MKFMFLIVFAFACVLPLSAQTDQKQINSTFSNDNADSFDDEFKASDKANKKEIDPFSSYNQAMTSFNDFFYTNLLNPTAKAYKTVLPKPVRNGINNIFDNLSYPIRLLNNLLQFKFKYSLTETKRFLINSTIGIAGIMDIANNKYNIKQHQEDFGQTLGFYGIGSGPHIVWPLLGPSNLRDSIGLVTDSLINPMTYMGSRGYNLLDSDSETLSVKTEQIINYSSLHVGEYEKLKKDAIDLYPFLKNIYEQRRKKQISE